MAYLLDRFLKPIESPATWFVLEDRTALHGIPPPFSNTNHPSQSSRHAPERSTGSFPVALYDVCQPAFPNAGGCQRQVVHVMGRLLVHPEAHRPRGPGG